MVLLSQLISGICSTNDCGVHGLHVMWPAAISLRSGSGRKASQRRYWRCQRVAWPLIMDRFLPRLQKVQGKNIVTQKTTFHNRQQMAFRITDGININTWNHLLSSGNQETKPSSLKGRTMWCSLADLNLGLNVVLSVNIIDYFPLAPPTFLFGIGDTAVAGALPRLLTSPVTVLILWVHLLLFDWHSLGVLCKAIQFKRKLHLAKLATDQISIIQMKENTATLKHTFGWIR